MPSLNILIYNKIIKQTVKPAVHVQNKSGLNMLQFEVNYVWSSKNTTHDSLKLTDESVYRSKYIKEDLLGFYIIFY